MGHRFNESRLHVCANDRAWLRCPDQIQAKPGDGRNFWWDVPKKKQHTKHNHQAQPPSTTSAFVAQPGERCPLRILHNIYKRAADHLTPKLGSFPHDPPLSSAVGHSSSTKVVTSEGKEPVGWLIRGMKKGGFLDDALRQCYVCDIMVSN